MTVDRAAIGRRSARIGTAAEAGVVKVLRNGGFPQAERRRVRRNDALDILVAPGVIASVKAGQYAKGASLGDLAAWHAEASAKRLEHGAAICLLIVQRTGYSADRADHWRTWVIGHHDSDRDHWETQTGRALRYVRGLGYGNPLEGE